MKLKDRVKTYSFWVSLTSAVILIIKLIGQKYGFAIDEIFISDLITTLCGLLVILGIIVVPKVDIKNDITSQIDKIELTDSTKLCDEIINNELQEKTEEEIPENNNDEEISCEFDNTLSILESPIENNYNNSETKDEKEIEEISQNSMIEADIKNHVSNLLNIDKNNYSNNFNIYKKILIDEINKIDE